MWVVSMGQCSGMQRSVDGSALSLIFEGLSQNTNLNNIAVKYSNLAICAWFIAQFLMNFTWLRKYFLFHLMQIYIL